MGWEDAPLVDESVGKIPAWMDAPLVDEESIQPAKEQSLLQKLPEFNDRLIEGIGSAAQNFTAGGLRGAGSIGSSLITAAKLKDYPGNKIAALLKGDKEYGIDKILSQDTARREGIDEGLTSLVGSDPTSMAYKLGKIGTEIAGTSAIPIPFASGAKGVLPRIGQAAKNIPLGVAAGGGQGFIAEGEKGVAPGMLTGGVMAAGLEGVKALGSAASNVIGPHLPRIDAAALLPQAIRERARQYLPKALQGETTGAERAALKTLTDSRVGEVEKAGLRKLMESHNPTLARQVEETAKNAERSQLEKLAQGATQEQAIKASNIAKGQVTSEFVPKMTNELEVVNRASKNLPLNLAKLNNHLDTVVNTPGIRMSDDAVSVLEGLKLKFKRAAELGGGTPNAHDIYEIRKSGINEIVDKITGRKNPDVSDKLTAKLTTELKPYIDDAIEKAGGKEWTNILQEYSRGMKAVDQQGLSATALKLHSNSPQKLVDLAKGNAPEMVEGQFGKGNFSFSDEMSTLNKLPKGQVGPPSLDTSKVETIKKVAEAVGKRLEADELGQKGAQKAMKILRADEGLPTLPGVISWKISTTNKIINALSGKGGEATNDALAKFMLSDTARMDKLIQGLPKTKQQMLLDAITQRALVTLPSEMAAQK